MGLPKEKKWDHSLILQQLDLDLTETIRLIEDISEDYKSEKELDCDLQQFSSYVDQMRSLTQQLEYEKHNELTAYLHSLETNVRDLSDAVRTKDPGLADLYLSNCYHAETMIRELITA